MGTGLIHLRNPAPDSPSGSPCPRRGLFHTFRGMTTAPSSRIRVLLIEDEESDYLMIQALLGQIQGEGVELEWANTFDEGLRVLGEGRHDVCLLDYFLGERTGLELLRQARSLAIRTPIVLLTGKGNRELDLEAMRSGAVDYLEKATRIPELVERSLRYAVERHRAQEALRLSEERHRGMFDHLPLGLFRVTESGEYIEANPALIRTLSYPEREGIRRAAQNFFVAPEDRDEFLRTLTDHGVVLGFETELVTANGRRVPSRTTARAHRGLGGAIDYIEGLVEDVSTLRRIEEPGLEAAAFRALMSASRVGIVIVAADGRVLRANPEAKALLQLSQQGGRGAVLWDYFVPSDSTAVASALEEVAGAKVASTSLSARPSGGKGRIRVDLHPLVDPEGDGAEALLVLLESEESGKKG